ncbi:DsbA family protein [Sphingobium sp. H33]|uniref:DsbA family protein n=2 Tax=Sphingobium nicotianae TaxID=2782607 RepID=A0A9X1IT04_9SPHN|nr:DsbA family protein [Sphingobium nicotianae]
MGLGLIGVVAAGGAAVAYAAVDGKPAMPADRAAIELVVRDYILNHPEIIPEAIDRLKAKQIAAKIEEHRSELESPYKGAWEGAEHPRVTLVAFMDYACGYCRASLPDLARLVKDNPDLRIVYRELPIITNDSVGAAKVSLLAAETGKFMSFHRAMYEAGDVAPGAVIKAAERAGLDTGKAKAALKAPGADAQIIENVRLAQALGAEGTPLFVLGDEMFTGAVGYDALKAAVDKVRNKG